MTDFMTGQRYKLKNPVYLWAGKLMPLKAKEPLDSEGLLDPGTTLAVRKVEVVRAPEMGTVTDVFAEVLTGPQKGKRVNITWISKTLKNGYTKRDPTVLEPLGQAPE